MVEIRIANKRDADAIAEVLREAFGVYMGQFTTEAYKAVTPDAEEIKLRFDEGPQWVALDDSEIVGTVSVTTDDESLYVRSMAVRPDAQWKGVGNKLLDAIDEYASKTEFDRVFLYTTRIVPGTVEFYKSHGYAWVRDTTADEWHGVPGLEMDKQIERDKKQNATGS